MGAQPHMMNTEARPVTNGAELEVLPKFKAFPPGKTRTAPIVLATVPRYAGTSVFCQMDKLCHMTGVTTIHISEYIVRLG